MRIEKQEAIKLRKSGKSYEEIRKALAISKSTLSDWFSNESWSRDITRFLNKENAEASVRRLLMLNREKKSHLNNLYAQARGEAEEEFLFLKYDPLFISSMMIYWGEGDKATRGQVRVSNSDPEMIKIFLNFLYKVCGTSSPRIWINLLVYPDNDVKKVEKFWRDFLKVDSDCFQKTTILQGREKTKRLEYGICSVGISSRYLKEKMLVWLKLLKDELIEHL
jgi:hypothetical protein